jgi:2-aminobenzoate-CoA ligase
VLDRCRPDRAIVDPALAADLATARAETGIDPTAIDPDAPPAPLPAPADTAADTPALILFTSGTTGEPKAAVHDHRAVLATATLWADEVLHPVADDVFAGTPPMAFAYGLAGLMLFPLSVGAATVVPSGRGVRGLAEAMAAVPPTVLFTAPTGYRRLADSVPDRALDRLRLAVSAGEPLPAAVAETWQARTGSFPVDVLGTTEMLSMVLTADPGVPGLRPVRGYAARLAPAPDLDAGPGSGRLEVQGPTGCHYLGAPAAQHAYVVDGWNRTGDLMSAETSGRLAYRARADDLILTRGYTVSGPEIEAVIDAQPGVRESAVIGVDDGAGGIELRALVVWDSHIVADETIIEALTAAVAARLAPWKVPRRVTAVDALPRTATGKLRRGALRGWSGAAPAG